MAAAKKVRVYDLARELKQDARRVIEDLRREGADVSVPSNSVSVEIADKVRLKYFPKTETAPKRAIKVIKAAKKESSDSDDAIHESEAPEISPVVEVPETETATEATKVKVLARKEKEEPAPAAPVVRKVLKKKEAEYAEPEPVEEAAPVEIPAPVEEPEPESVVAAAPVEQPEEAPAAPVAEESRPEPAPATAAKPTGTQVKRLTLTTSDQGR